MLNSSYAGAVKDGLKKFLPLVSLAEKVLSLSDTKAIAQLSESPLIQAAKLQEFLYLLASDYSLQTPYWMASIEAQRTRLNSLDQDLIDGSLGEGGIYDAGQTISSACRIARKPLKDCLKLYLLIRAMNPSTVIELGTNVGISSAYIGFALAANGSQGQLTRRCINKR